MFQQNTSLKPIRDFVFPLGVLIKCSNGDDPGAVEKCYKFELRGTGFFIGSNGTALTAAHVVDQMSSDGIPIALFAHQGRWVSIKVIRTEKHMSEDVAVIKLDLQPTFSFFQISPTSEHSSCKYELWGYPSSVADELKGTLPPPHNDITNPELIYNFGYFRRRISREMPYGIFRGSSFYELSEVAGSCCSGAPVVKLEQRSPASPWKVVGVYIGEQTSTGHAAVGYAVRSDEFYSWVPDMLGVKLEEIGPNL